MNAYSGSVVFGHMSARGLEQTNFAVFIIISFGSEVLSFIILIVSNPFLMLLEQSKPSGQGFDSHGLIIRDFGELKPSVRLGVKITVDGVETLGLLHNFIGGKQT